ncbi:MAG: CsbD family protein [Atopostipes suicloacalis]|nr:CsbD family protein [Atopostipes suicloacalis]
MDFKAQWNKLKGEVQNKWGKLTNDDMDVIEGDEKILVGKLQERYDMSEEEAQKEVDSFKAE